MIFKSVSNRARLLSGNRIELYEFVFGTPRPGTVILSYLRQLQPGDFPNLSPTTKSWNAFFGQFKKAVAGRNSSQLAHLMTDDFIASGFHRSKAPLRVDLQRYLDNHDLFAEVEDILSSAAVKSGPLFPGRQYTWVGLYPCPHTNSQCKNILQFEQASNLNWHFSAVLEPGG
jgi:hypothetical protein